PTQRTTRQVAGTIPRGDCPLCPIQQRWGQDRNSPFRTPIRDLSRLSWNRSKPGKCLWVESWTSRFVSWMQEIRRLLHLYVTRELHRSLGGTNMRKSSQRALELAMLAAIVCSGPTYAQTSPLDGGPGQDRQDLRQDRRDLRQDRQDRQGDRRDLRQDNRDLRDDRQD